MDSTSEKRNEMFSRSPFRAVELLGETEQGHPVNILFTGVHHYHWPKTEYDKAFNFISEWKRIHPEAFLIEEKVVVDSKPTDPELGKLWEYLNERLENSRSSSLENGQLTYLNEPLRQIFSTDHTMNYDMTLTEITTFLSRKGITPWHLDRLIIREVAKMLEEPGGSPYEFDEVDEINILYTFVLLSSRNSRVLAHLHENIYHKPDTPHSYVVLYGDDHVDDFVNSFVESGYTIVSQV